jgi:hypothetical protein
MMYHGYIRGIQPIYQIFGLFVFLSKASDQNHQAP